MTLKNTRAAFEKAITDAVLDNDPTIEIVGSDSKTVSVIAFSNAARVFFKVIN